MDTVLAVAAETACFHYSTQHMWVRWDEGKIRLSRILSAVAELGYSARPYDAAKHSALLAGARRSALKRFTDVRNREQSALIVQPTR